jgi:hypothetical protein
VDRARQDLDRPWVERVTPTFIWHLDAVATEIAQGKRSGASPGTTEAPPRAS